MFPEYIEVNVIVNININYLNMTNVFKRYMQFTSNDITGNNIIFE